MSEDRERAERFLAVDRYGEDTPENRKMLYAARLDRVEALEVEFAARDEELVAAARKVLKNFKTDRDELELMVLNPQGSDNSSIRELREQAEREVEDYDALAALVEGVGK